MISSSWGRFRRARAIAFGGLLGLLLATIAAPSEAVASRPWNVVLIQVDDMSRSLLRSKVRINGRAVPAMPNVLGQISGGGGEIRHFYSNDPICGPSRASLLSGRATHNHGMQINADPYGYPVWRNGPYFEENLPVWLQRSGYVTAHIGKYINGYGMYSENEVPPGWNRWVTPIREAGSGYYGSTLNIDGRIVPSGAGWRNRDPADCRPVFFSRPRACHHSTDLFTSFALKEISEAGKTGRPFYLQLDYNAPHDDGRMAPGPTPPTRLRRLSSKVVPGHDLADHPPAADAPVFFRDQPVLSGSQKSEIRKRYANEVLSMRGVDEGVGRILDLLRKLKELDNTYVIFTSDNGMFHGEHRIAYGKYMAHEPASRQPFLVRGPGIEPGTVSPTSGSTIDIAPTVMRIAGNGAGGPLDGRSLLRDLKDPGEFSRIPVLLEGFNGRDPLLPEEFLDGSGQKRPNQAMVLNFSGFVYGRWKYVRYSYGDHELYDLKADPGERDNLADDARFLQVVTWADDVTDRLRDCAGSECRVPSAGPYPPPPS